MRILVAVVLWSFAVGLLVRTGRRGSPPKARVRFAQLAGPAYLSSYDLPRLSKEDNAAVLLEAAARVIVLPITDAQLAELAKTPSGSWTIAERTQAEESVTRNQLAIGLLHEATRRPRSSYAIAYREGISARVPSFSELLTAARLLLVDARLGLETGDHQRAHASVAAYSRLVDSLYGESILVLTHCAAGLELDLHSFLASVAADASRRDRETIRFVADVRQHLPSGDPLLSLRRSAAFDSLAMSYRAKALARWPWKERTQMAVLGAATDPIAAIGNPAASGTSVVPSAVSPKWPPFTSPVVRRLTIHYPAVGVQLAATARMVTAAALAARATTIAGPVSRQASDDLAHLLAGITPLTGRPLRVERHAGLTIGLDVDEGTKAQHPRIQRTTWSTPPLMISLPDL